MEQMVPVLPEELRQQEVEMVGVLHIWLPVPLDLFPGEAVVVLQYYQLNQAV